MYNHKEIEKKWQNKWDENSIFKTNLDSKKKKYYALDMFPYPSGTGLHVGHPEGYTATDIVSRYKKLNGYEVLHPMGWDAFGLPAEQYAIKTGNSPKTFTLKNIQNFKKQLKSLGFSYDWTKEINTSDKKYFKTTQWIFAQLFKHGLAEIKEIDVNWSPSLNTVLANEEVLEDEKGNKVSERDGLPVELKKMKQWVLKITKYADKLFNGLDNLDWPESVKKLQKNWIFEKDENGKFTNELHLKDWVFARQRYWGEPFPIIHLDDGELYLIPENNYPLELPKIDDYKFSNDGRPALSNAKDWINVELSDGRKGTRDLNTMPQWAGSCWYYIGYILKENNGFLEIDSKKAKERIDNWLPVDLYVGGQEHAVLHLMYARFWHIFLSEIGITKIKEPFKKLFNQGMILGPDGLKMSKSKGNVINPDDMIEKYGSDSLRIYEMFMGPLDDDKAWSDKGINGIRNWIDKIYKLFLEKVEIIPSENELEENKYAFNELLNKIEGYYDKLKFNVSISEMMIFINHISKTKKISKEMINKFLIIFSTIAPHISDEINSKINDKEEFLYLSNWPEKYIVKTKEEKRIVIIQIDGKTRKVINDLKDDLNKFSEKQLIEFTKLHVGKYLIDKSIKKIMFVKDKIVSISLEEDE